MSYSIIFRISYSKLHRCFCFIPWYHTIFEESSMMFLPLWTSNYFRVRFYCMVRTNYNERSSLKCTLSVASALHATVLAFYLADHAEPNVYVFKNNSWNCGLLSVRGFSTTHSDQTCICEYVIKILHSVHIRGRVRQKIGM